MKRTISIASLLLIVLLALTACGGKKPAPTAAPSSHTTTVPAAPAATNPPTQLPPTATTAPKPTATPKPMPTATPKPMATSTTAAAAESLPVLKAGVLKSYVMQLEVKMTGEGNTPQTEMKAEMRIRNKPAPESYAMTISGINMGGKSGGMTAGNGKMEMVVVGQDAYLLVPGQNKWVKFPMTKANSLLPFAQDLLDPGKMAKDAPASLFNKTNVVNRHEKIDGVDTTHYKYSESQIPQLFKDSTTAGQTLVSGQVDYWVANKGSYLKQAMIKIIMKDKSGQQVQQTSHILITKENEPVKIETPTPDQVMTMPGFTPPTPSN